MDPLKVFLVDLIEVDDWRAKELHVVFPAEPLTLFPVYTATALVVVTPVMVSSTVGGLTALRSVVKPLCRELTKDGLNSKAVT